MLAFVLASCLRDSMAEDTVEVTFRLSGSRTKTSFTGSADIVGDVVVFLYRRGQLDAVVSSDNEDFVLSLVEGDAYSAYALANVGGFEPPASESELSGLSVDIDGSIPMCWHDELVPARGGVVEVDLDRLVAELRFSVDPSLLPGLEITSVRLCQAASSVMPFVEQSSAESTGNGDFASPDDLAAINSGEAIVLYMPENCQGDLLPWNHSPMAKLPDNLEHPELCTYLEVGCRFADSSALDGEVRYRLYPGLDDCSNFDIIRNCRYQLTLCLTTGGLDELSWRVDVDAEFRDGLADVAVARGLHQLNDMYVGEISRLSLSLEQSLEDFLGASLMDCELILCDSDGNRCPNASFSDLYIYGGHLCCDIHALAATDPSSTYSLRLSSGTRSAYVDCYSDVVIRKPYLSAQIDDHLFSPVINGSADSFEVFLFDSQGRNLNSSAAYGFDLSLFSDISFACELNPLLDEGNTQLNQSVSSCHHFTSISGSERDDGPLVTYTVSLTNDGTSGAMNHEFSRLCGMDRLLGGPIWNYAVTSANAVGLDYPVGLGILPVHIWYYGDLTQYGTLTVRGYGSENDAYIAVNNPSKISLATKVWTLGYGIIGSSPLPGCTVTRFMTSDSRCEDELSGSSYDFVMSPEYSGLYYRSEVDDYDVECYPLVVNSGNGFKSIAGMQKKLNDSSKSWKSGQADIRLATVSGNPISYTIHDIYEATTSSYNHTVIGDRGFSGLSSWGPDDLSFTKRDRFTSILGDYKISWVESVMEDAPMSISMFWNQSYGLRLSTSGNTTSFKVSVKAVYRTSCKWQKNNNDSVHTANYETTMTYNPSTVFSATSSTTTILSRVEVEREFAEINKTYWHECSTNLGNLAGNRFARLALPVSVDVEVTLLPTEAKWAPCTVSTAGGSASVTNYTIYNNTKRGTYPVNDSDMQNPDGSSRGDHDSASSVAAKYGDYVVASSADYDINVSAAGLRIMHCM